jgi:hypothetical protein
MTIEYKGFQIKLMVDEFADSPLDNQTLPIGFLAEYVKRTECGVNDTDSILFGKIDTDSRDGVTYFEVGEEYEVERGEYLFELTTLKDWGSCENPEQAAKGCIEALAQELHYYHNGESYGYGTEYKGEQIDSCWGFYGSDWCIQWAKDTIDSFTPEYLLELDLPSKLVLR